MNLFYAYTIGVFHFTIYSILLLFRFKFTLIFFNKFFSYFQFLNFLFGNILRTKKDARLYEILKSITKNFKNFKNINLYINMVIVR